MGRFGKNKGLKEEANGGQNWHVCLGLFVDWAQMHVGDNEMVNQQSIIVHK